MPEQKTTTTFGFNSLHFNDGNFSSSQRFPSTYAYLNVDPAFLSNNNKIMMSIDYYVDSAMYIAYKL